ncbi:MAG: flagellar protein FlgN [Lachnospiraceae bacterium]|nr:flagellar protein FlgN [Lachnospiraceae bacterium]
MASLMENLMEILEQENTEYKTLLDLSMKKTRVIVANDIVELSAITEEEQKQVDRINALDKQRMVAMQDIANVMNMDVQTLKLGKLIEMLAGRPAEQRRLTEVKDALHETTQNMARINAQNKELLENALELVEFDLNIVRGLKAAPETAEYNRGAMSAGNLMGIPAGRFDAKQ